LNPAQSYAAKNPLRSVTFAANHDTDGIVTDKMLAYAFILTYQGYPTIFWKDYYDYGLAHGGGNGVAGAGNGIAPLVWSREKLAGGSPTIDVLKSDDPQMIIYQSHGVSSDKPGYIVVINSNPTTWKGAGVQTNNTYLQNSTLKAYAWSSTVAGQNTQPANQPCDGTGSTQVYAPPRGYAVYSVSGF
jgi:alpha-amylase